MYLQDIQKAIHLHHRLFIHYVILSSCININNKYNYDCQLTLSLIITYMSSYNFILNCYYLLSLDTWYYPGISSVTLVFWDTQTERMFMYNKHGLCISIYNNTHEVMYLHVHTCRCVTFHQTKLFYI